MFLRSNLELDQIQNQYGLRSNPESIGVFQIKSGIRSEKLPPRIFVERNGAKWCILAHCEEQIGSFSEGGSGGHEMKNHWVNPIPSFSAVFRSRRLTPPTQMGVLRHI